MSKINALPMAILLVLSALIVGCGSTAKKSLRARTTGEPVYYALAEIRPTNGNSAAGKVWFSEAFGKVKIAVDIAGLDKNSKHGFHIHEFGDCSASDAVSAGGHFNPSGHAHGDMDVMKHHAGDLGNLVSDKNGRAVVTFEVVGLSVNGEQNPIVGRGLIVHKDKDDYVTQPTGGAGSRIGCGVIGAATKFN